MFMISFFEISKGVLQKIDYYRSCSFGKEIITRKNIDLLDGILFANPKNMVVWGFII